MSFGQDILKRIKTTDDFNSLKDVYEGWEATVAGYNVKVVDQEGGEGEGDTAHFVYKISDAENTTFIKCEIGYASYDGFYWDDWKSDLSIVELRPVMRNEWVDVD